MAAGAPTVPQDAWIVLAVALAAAALFASGRAAIDVVALFVVLALVLSGVLTAPEALAGFGQPVVILVAGLLILGDLLSRTGVAYAAGNFILRRAKGSEPRLIALLMGAAGLLGSVMSSTAVVAIFLPVAQAVARSVRISPSRLLLPLAYAALISGMLTLIATTPNLIAAAELRARGYEPLGFFSFTPIGLAVLAAAAIGAVVFRRFIPARAPACSEEATHTTEQIIRRFSVQGRLLRLRVEYGPLDGLTIQASRLAGPQGMRIVAIERAAPARSIVDNPGPADVLHRADVLLAVASGEAPAEEELRARGLSALPVRIDELQAIADRVGLAAAVVHPESTLIGQTLAARDFRARHNLHVIAIKRAGETIHDLAGAKLHAGDSLLLVGPWTRIRALKTFSPDFVVTDVPAEMLTIPVDPARAPLALGLLGVMVLLSALEIVPVVIAVLIAVLAAVILRALPAASLYRAVHWPAIVLIGGLFALAAAMQKTGLIDAAASSLSALVSGAGPYTALAAVFAVTSLAGVFLSNTATAIIMAPVAIQLAEDLGHAPQPFAMTVAIAASAAFLTPVSSPVVTLVYEPGRYRFTDFLKLGAPLTLATLAITLLLVPLILPFKP